MTFEHETADDDRFENAVRQSVREILRVPDPAPFLDWAVAELPDLLGLETQELTRNDEARIALMLATALWNATPLPRRGYRGEPMAGPHCAAPCLCGSGRMYRDCCGQSTPQPVFPEALVWQILLDELTEAQIRTALDANAIPRLLYPEVAGRWLDEGHPKKAAALLEPLFADAAEDLEHAAVALDLLCDAYDDLDHWRKKQKFLKRMSQHDDHAIAAAAWQRLTAIGIDDGDYQEARRTFEQALRSAPDDPGMALLEIALLAAQHDEDHAARRAEFWHRRLTRLDCDNDEVLAFLREAAASPQQALLRSHAEQTDPRLLELQTVVTTICERPLPSYHLAPARTEQAPETMQLSLFDPDLEPKPRARRATLGRRVRLRPAREAARLEKAWRPIFPAPKPLSTRLTLTDENRLWIDDDWIRQLSAHPEAGDSLDILDDVTMALYQHPECSLPWNLHALLLPLLERARSILQAALAADPGAYTPWDIEANRPALRLLFRLYLSQLEQGLRNDVAETLEYLLRLNPDDNQGVRAELMNHYLRHHQDELALDLAGRFPDDRLAELAYGQVLALYRLGEQGLAAEALQQAVGKLPRIPRFLTQQRIKPPTMRPAGPSPSSDDEAWLYRETMRDLWEAEPGILAWLKRRTAEPG